MAAEKASQEMVETPDDSKAESEQPVVDTEKMQESKKIKKVTVQEPDKGLEWYLIGADVNSWVCSLQAVSFGIISL